MTVFRATLLGLFGALVLARPSPVAADVTPLLSDEWESWAEIGVVGSTELHRGEFAFFVPWGTESTIGFLDLRAKVLTDFDDEDGFEGNFAAGVRHMLDTPVLGQGWNIGGWGGADIRHSDSNNAFWQFSTGLELLSADWDVRINGYVPLNKRKDADPSRVDFDFSGERAFMKGAAEVSLYGVDGEVGWRIPFERWSSETDWWQPENHAVRFLIGGFHFEDDEASEDVSGPRVRGEWNMFNVLPGSSRAQLTFSAEYQWDEVRNAQWSGGLRFRLPIGPNADAQAIAQIAASNGLEARRKRRMTERIVRDVDIVVGKTPRERVEVVATGIVLERVVVVTPQTEDPAAAIESAGENGLAIIDGTNFRILVNRSIRLNPGQVLLGGGRDLAIRGRRTGVTTVFPAPGTFDESELNGRADDNESGLIVAADNVLVQGVNVINTSGTGHGLSLFRNTGVVLDDVVLRGVAAIYSRGGSLDPAFHDEFILRNSQLGGNVGIDAVGRSRMTLDNALVLPSTTGLLIDGDHEIAVKDSVFSTFFADGHAIVLDGAASVTLDDSEVRTRGLRANAIHQIGAGVELTINRSELKTTRTDAEVVFALAGELAINDSTIISSGANAHGLAVGGPTSLSVSGGSITTESSTADGVSVLLFGAQPTTLTLEGLTVRASRNAVFFDGDTFGIGSVQATINGTELSAGFGHDEIAVLADGTSTVHLSVFDNELDNGAGTIELDERLGTIRVVQGAPGSGAAGIDAQNGIPSPQVEIPVNAVDFDQPFP